MRTCFEFNIAAPALLVLLLSFTAYAHEDDSHMVADMDMDMTMTGAGLPLNATSSNATIVVPINYFRHPENSYLILAHIVLMTIGWVFVLPVGMSLG